jgi:[acyl-carrier-protein] S-malonyltransferase
MGRDLAAGYPAAREIYEQANAILGFDLTAICFEGPEADLNATLNTQPAVLTTGIATLRALQSEQADAQPAMLAGHSFGEITALVAAEALSFEDGVRLARERGRLMKQAGEAAPGAMAALLGLEIDAVEAICAQARADTNAVLVVANDNCPGQVVISGEEVALDRALELASEAGARRAVKLAVSIAAHSPLMQSVVNEYRAFLDSLQFAAPQIPVYGNLSAAPLSSVDAIRDDLEQQLTGRVRWTESMQAMIAAGAGRFVELGANDVLSGLLRRIDRDVERVALNSADALTNFLENVE